ncbi:MAG: DNA-binding protein [Mucilaginibacter sp.]|nr:DNA-binding protein [Mucilaginibacter sp.]
MSSNIRLNRICEECNKLFIAQTTVTRFCSKACNGKNHKRKIKLLKIGASDQETKKIIDRPKRELNGRVYLSIQDTCTLLNISRTSLWRLVNQEVIKAYNLGGRKIIKRAEIDKLFTNL